MADVQPSLETLDSLLPADAPAEHECWTKVKLQDVNKWPLCRFTIGTGAEKVVFQTTQRACGGSPEITERVARACYIKFEEGSTVEQVKEFRQGLYEKLKELRGKPSAKPAKGSPSASPPIETQVEPADTAAPASSSVAVAAPLSSPEPSGAAAERVHSPVTTDLANRCVYFKYEPRPGEKMRKFSVSTSKCGDSQEEALRILEACLEAFVAGASAEDMELRRKLMFSNLSTDDPAGVKVAEVGKKVADTAVLQGETEALASPRAVEMDIGDVASSPPPEAENSMDLEDAPVESDAWRMVKTDRTKGVCYMNSVLADGTKQRFQTTSGALDGRLDEAARIARLCWMKFHAGASLDEVKEYRSLMYDRVKGGSGKVSGKVKRADGGPAGEEDPRKRRKLTGNSLALSTLKAEGRLQDALLIEGRDPDKKNASVNGVYSVIPEGFAGKAAYEKFGDLKRFLYFWPGKSRWKISDALGDEAKGFAFLQVKDTGVEPPLNAGSDEQWQVFDGKGQGYGRDPAMKCTLVGSDAAEGVSSTASTAGNQGAAEATSSAAEPVGDAVAAQESQKSSVSSGSTSDSDSGSKAPPDAPAPPPNPVEESSLAPAEAAHSNGSHMVPLRPPKGMVCAKMLARAKLRYIGVAYE